MGKVLLINDSKFESIIIKDILNSMGHDARVSDEYHAVSEVKNYNPDVVIVNYIMKEIRGDQLIALVKLSNPDTKCILSSSNDFNDKEFEHKRIDAFIHTPIDRSGMEKALNTIGSKSDINKQSEKVQLVEKSDQVDNVKFIDEISETQREETIDSMVHEFEVVRFCPSCGLKLIEKNGESIRFCSYCGNKL